MTTSTLTDTASIPLGARAHQLTREPVVADLVQLQRALQRLERNESDALEALLATFAARLGVDVTELEALTIAELNAAMAAFLFWAGSPTTGPAATPV